MSEDQAVGVVGVVSALRRDAITLDRSVISLVGRIKTDYFELGRALIEIEDKKAYGVLGFKSIREYIFDRLERGGRWWEFLRREVEARSLHPVLDAAVVKGEIKGDVLRAMVPVLREENVDRIVGAVKHKALSEVRPLISRERTALNIKPQNQMTSDLGGHTLNVRLNGSEYQSWVETLELFERITNSKAIGVNFVAILEAATAEFHSTYGQASGQGAAAPAGADPDEG